MRHVSTHTSVLSKLARTSVSSPRIPLESSPHKKSWKSGIFAVEFPSRNMQTSKSQRQNSKILLSKGTFLEARVQAQPLRSFCLDLLVAQEALILALLIHPPVQRMEEPFIREPRLYIRIIIYTFRPFSRRLAHISRQCSQQQACNCHGHNRVP